jgi:hypothetical protein
MLPDLDLEAASVGKSRAARTAASWRTSQRAERAIEHSAMHEQLKRKESHE